MPVRKAHWLTAKAAPSSSPQPTMFADVTCESAVEALRCDGLFIGISLPKQICADIASFAERTTCFAGSNRKVEFLPDEHGEAEQRFNQAILNGNYFEKVLECDALRAVQRDPLLQDIAAHYLGGQARLSAARVWWTFPTMLASAAEKRLASQDEYHFDLLDWRMVKFFFHLKPVDEGSGPHVYVRGSHKRRALRHQLTPFIGHPVDDVLRVYGADKPVTLLGDAGFGFVEDPFGFHRATIAELTPRLMMEIAFGVSPRFV
ncbi:MAG TPA: hypothetical protein VK604_17060 [Bryobacteraceae bacterium]|nr:hypothetical protein [Bryobacteraceae bacterium]